MSERPWKTGANSKSIESHQERSSLQSKFLDFCKLLGIEIVKNVKKLRDSRPSVTQAWGPMFVIAVGWRKQCSCVLRLVSRVENLREPRELNTKEFWEWHTVKWISDKFVRLFVALSCFLLPISLFLSCLPPSLSLFPFLMHSACWKCEIQFVSVRHGKPSSDTEKVIKIVHVKVRVCLPVYACVCCVWVCVCTRMLLYARERKTPSEKYFF